MLWADGKNRCFVREHRVYGGHCQSITKGEGHAIFQLADSE
ncbi:hypothetical protein THTE_2854 [Thermogutta terrifontis]|uniref:Uncharacterized protein n=1 Tax=Thermogutta terrifontis TaxID=1331910 RepID=A0A286RHQ5_9BACT|nr:hypothetical protein THTE_2854 [Thermogutta terrifontis]